MNLSVLLGLILFLVLSFCPFSIAVNCYVSTTGDPGELLCTDVNNPCDGFAPAIASAADCTDIFAFGGTYTGVNNFALLETSLPLTIQPFNGTVIVDPQQNGRFLRVLQDVSLATNLTFIARDIEVRNGLQTGNQAGAAFLLQLTNTVGNETGIPAVFDGVTFTNNAVSGGGPNGGAINAQNIPITIRNCNFTGNSATCSTSAPVHCRGGAIRTFVNEATARNDVIIEDSLFQENSITNLQTGLDPITEGGAISTAAHPGDNATTVTIRRSSFINNTATADQGTTLSIHGGALALDSAQVIIECDDLESEQCIFSGNRIVVGLLAGLAEGGAGGAIAVRIDDSSGLGQAGLSLENVILYDNQAVCGSSCGPAYGGGAVASVITNITSCRFCSNEATDSSGQGDDIFVYPSAVETRALNAFLPTNVFACDSGPNDPIEPIGFTCTGPECSFITSSIDPVTGVCEACEAPFLTPTPSPSPSPSSVHYLL